MTVVLGAGAMGAALAIVHERAGVPVTLLGTRFDDATIEAGRSGRPHPALGVVLPSAIDCRPHVERDEVLAGAGRIVLAVSSEGLADVVADACSFAPGGTVWVVATKGWDAETLRTPSEVIASADEGARVVILAGPALAPELVAGAPTAMVCASVDADAAGGAAEVLSGGGVHTTVIDDVAGAEVSAAYKNVTAIAVGMCEGLSEHLSERVLVHRFANARAAMYAHGLEDTERLASARGGRIETILGLAGAGDLYVTCLGGRNGSFGRLLGAGETADQAQTTIGSTVEGVGNTASALAIAERLGVGLVAAKAVDLVLSGATSPVEAVAAALATASA